MRNPTAAMEIDDLDHLVRDLDPAIRGVVIRLIREADEPALGATQLQLLRAVLSQLEDRISNRLTAAGEQD